MAGIETDEVGDEIDGGGGQVHYVVVEGKGLGDGGVAVGVGEGLEVEGGARELFGYARGVRGG